MGTNNSNGSKDLLMNKVLPKRTMQKTLDGNGITGGIKELSYAKADTGYQTHGLLPYPARMIPQVARTLIQLFSETKETVLDPFCGSGTVLVECRLLERNGIGNDINPLATLIAKVKSTPINPTRLAQQITIVNKKIERLVKKVQEGQEYINPPFFHNIQHWFKQNAVSELTCIRDSIETIGEERIQNALKVCFSLTVLRSSNMDFDNSPTHPRAIPASRLKAHNPKPVKIFREACRDLNIRMKRFYRDSCKGVKIRILTSDARELRLDKKADLIVTSPPYGEEQNTIGYTRWSKLVLYWLGYDENQVRTLGKNTLGGRKHENIEIHSPKLLRTLQQVQKEKPRLAKSARQFFADYQTCLQNMERLLRKNAHCCIVIGNRSVMGKRIPMDLVTQEIISSMNFEHMGTDYRKIPNKDMPYRNVAGRTINRENIILLKYVGD